MDKFTFELEKAKVLAKIHMWTQVKDVVVLLAKLSCVCLCIFLIMDGLVAMADNNPDAINAIANVVKNMKVSNIILYIVTATSLGYGYNERRGKKRAIQKMADYQYQVEQGDPYRGSSKLTSQGDTPKKKGAKK